MKFKNNRTALKTTALLMALIMMVMVIMPATQSVAEKDTGVYTAKAEELIQNIYEIYLENGKLTASSNTELDGFAIYVLNQAEVDVLSWEFEGRTVEEELDKLIAEAITKEAEESTKINAKHMASLYIAAESSNKTEKADELLDLLKTRQNNSVNGGFLDGDFSEYTNLPVFDMLTMLGKLDKLEKPNEAFEYIKNLNPVESEFPDLMSISQTGRILKGFEVQLNKEINNDLIQGILQWQKNNQEENGSFNAGGGDASTNTSEVLWTLESLGLLTVFTETDKDNALNYLMEKDSFANIGANVWTLKSLLLSGAEPNIKPSGIDHGEQKVNNIKIRIEGPDYTILPETLVEVKGAKSYSEILIENAEALGYTVEETDGFISSINDIPGETYWAVEPYEESYKDGDSFVFYGGGSSNTGEITVVAKDELENSFTALVKDVNGDPIPGARVIYYTKDNIKTPTTVETLTDVNGKVEILVEENGTYYFAAHKINTGVYPEPDNGLVRTLAKLPTTKTVEIKVALIDDKGQVIYGPKTIGLKGNDEFSITALGALNETGLNYLTSYGNDFVTEIEGIENLGLSGWMFAVNGTSPEIPAIDTTVEDGDEVLWYYSKSSTDEAPSFPKESFTDVGPDMGWAKEAIEYLAEKKIISGTGDNKFEPKRSITRAEFAKVIVEVSGENQVSEETEMFSDVDSTKWYADYVGKAFAMGLMKGSHGKFAPMDNISRNEVAVVIHRMAKDDKANNEAIGFKDESSIPEWASDSVAYVVENELVKGYDDNTFRGEQAMTRAEVAVVLYRYIQMNN